ELTSARGNALLQLFAPILDDRDGHTHRVVSQGVDEESAVGCHFKLPIHTDPADTAPHDSRLEQRGREAGHHVRAMHRNRYDHQRAVWGNEVHLLAIVAPLRGDPSCRRHRRVGPWSRKWLDTGRPSLSDSYATQWPSGENTPHRSSKGVFTNANGFPSPF